MSPVDIAPEFVKSSFEGMELRQASQVPFTYKPIDVPQLAQPVGKGDFINRQSTVFPVDLKLLVGRQIGVGIISEFAMGPAGKQASPGRAAYCTAYIAIGKNDPGCGQFINIGRFYLGASSVSQVAIPQVVGQDNDEIRPIACCYTNMNREIQNQG